MDHAGSVDFDAHLLVHFIDALETDNIHPVIPPSRSYGVEGGFIFMDDVFVVGDMDPHVHFPYALGPYGVFSALDFFVPSNDVDHPNGDIEILEQIALPDESVPDRFDNHAVIMVNGRSLSYPGLISKRVKDGDPVNVSFERYYIPHSLYGGMFSYVIRNDDSVSSHVVSLLDVIPWEIKCWYHTEN